MRAGTHFGRSNHTRGHAVAVLAGSFLLAGAFLWALWRLEPETFRITFPPPPSEPDGWGPLFRPSASGEVKPVALAADTFEPTTSVLAVTVGGESRAYPLTVMAYPADRKVVNDTLGGQPIAVTYWDLCERGIVYARRLDGREMTLGASGHLLDDRVMVMYDAETGTSWSQASGLALEGPLAGKRLRQLPSALTKWGPWRDRHPSGTVLTSVREQLP